MNTIHRLVLGLCIGLLAAGGCRTKDWEATRRSEADAYPRNLQNETREILAAHPDGLDLSNCVAIARERNTKLVSGRVEEKIASLDKQAAFSAFLPQVQLSYDTMSLSEPYAKTFNGNGVVFQDSNIHESSVQIVQPLFAPSEWLMYRTAKRGQEISTLVQKRTGQMIELAVVNLFFQCCALGEEIGGREKDVEAAQQVLKQAESMRNAGYATETDVARARAQTLERERELASAKRNAEYGRARLLAAMDLWPLAPVRLKPESLLEAAGRRWTVRTPGEKPVEMAARDLADVPVQNWMLHAMLSRPEMSMQDRAIALRHNEALRALALFLPNVVGFANYYTTSDSYTVNQEYWGSGLQASLSAFVGFRTVQEYRKAREQEKEAYIEREENAMMVLVQVVEAYKNLRDTREALDVADAAATAAEKTLADTDSEYRAGLTELPRRLEAQAANSEAQARRRTAAFADVAAFYAFRNVVGGNIDEHNPSP